MRYLKGRWQEPCVLAWATTRVLVDWPEHMTSPGVRTLGMTHQFGFASQKSWYKPPESLTSVVRTVAPTSGFHSRGHGDVEEAPRLRTSAAYLGGGTYFDPFIFLALAGEGSRKRRSGSGTVNRIGQTRQRGLVKNVS